MIKGGLRISKKKKPLTVNETVYLWGTFLDKIFDKIGRQILPLEEIHKIICSFRLTKEEARRIIKILEGLGLIEARGGGHVRRQIKANDRKKGPIK